MHDAVDEVKDAGGTRRTRPGTFWTAACAVACAALAVAAGCGSRTTLFLADPCGEEGEERPCRGICGEGIQRCEDGHYGECFVPRVERACTNACGSGVEACENERWSACVVPPLERGCQNVCGAGLERCTDGRWGACDVPVTTFPCSTECGAGTALCQNGVLGECDVPTVRRECRSICGTGHESCSGGVWGACDAPQPRPPELTVFVRDFNESHPDFEPDIVGDASDPGIVEFELGPDDKPVYQRRAPTTPTTTGRDNFDQWYRDTPPVNMTMQIELPLTPSPTIPGFFVYYNDEFFPIDGELFGNESHPHNYHFTLEARTTFEYRGGEVWSFAGDDDMWVFVNRRLAIDLGGLHPKRAASVALDDLAESHGLVAGNVYLLHFFFAERHTIHSTFNIETSIAEPGSCD